jgi:Arc/MetJ-type ribon-helix-helix transcriptional regulator
LYTRFGKEPDVAGKIVTLKLNQQQLEFVDRLIVQGLAADRASLMRLALREFAAKAAAAESPK